MEEQKSQYEQVIPRNVNVGDGAMNGDGVSNKENTEYLRRRFNEMNGNKPIEVMKEKTERIMSSIIQVRSILDQMNYRYTSSVDDTDMKDIGTHLFDDARKLLLDEYRKLISQFRDACLETKVDDPGSLSHTQIVSGRYIVLDVLKLTEL